MKKGPFVIISLSYLLLFSCNNDKDIIDNPLPQTDTTSVDSQIITLSATQGPLLVVTLSGQIINLGDVSSDFECGIEYSTDQSFGNENTTRCRVNTDYTEKEYSIDLFGFSSEKQYYYRAYYINNRTAHFGDVKSFMFIWNAPKVITQEAVLSSGRVYIMITVEDLNKIAKELQPFEVGDFGIEYSTDDSFSIANTITLRPSSYEIERLNDTITLSFDVFDYDTQYYYRAFYSIRDLFSYGEIKTFYFEWEPQAIDLGLSVKWASCNVGAHHPWEYGDYFAWAEIETKTYYSWDNCKYYVSGNTGLTSNYSKYNGYGEDDYSSILEPEDDVAHMKWGDAWRMPTYEEFFELRSVCSWEWSSFNGVNGLKFTSNKYGFTDKSIFLPASGLFFNDELHKNGAEGFYWSSTQYASSSTALATHIDSCLVEEWINARCDGFSVRPVCP